MWKSIVIASLAVLVLMGCKGTDGDDGKISVTLTSSTAFRNSSAALGCFIVDSDTTQCLCYESGTIYTGTASGSSSCTNVASSLTLVAEGTKISDVTEGDHYYCSSTNNANWGTLCQDGDANTSTASLEKQSGKEGTTGIPGTNGDSGDDNDYTILYTDTGRSISK